MTKMNCRPRSPLPVLVASAVVAFVSAGCSQEASHGVVNGSVTLDGSPLPSGLIRFIPEDGQSPTADATIADGDFQAKVPVGNKRVTISAPKVVGQRKAYDTPDSPTIDVVKELLPAEYNVRSTLTITVVPGKQTVEFQLKSANNLPESRP